jgi:hypothetical protein
MVHLAGIRNKILELNFLTSKQQKVLLQVLSTSKQTEMTFNKFEACIEPKDNEI